MYLTSEDKKYVAFLCRRPDSERPPEPFGTCFVVGWRSRDGEVRMYLVTAKHVPQELSASKDEVFVRTHAGISLEPEGFLDIPISTSPGDWLFHNDESVDLAIHPWAPLGLGSRFHYKPLMLQDITVQLERWITAGRTLWPPRDGEDVLFVGLMVNLAGRNNMLPVVRRGSVALITDEPLRGEYGDSGYHVIEAQAYPGSSGSLVFAVLGQHLFPLGVLTFSYPSLEELRPVRGTSTAYYNLGLSLVTPIERVTEIIDAIGS